MLRTLIVMSGIALLSSASVQAAGMPKVGAGTGTGHATPVMNPPSANSQIMLGMTGTQHQPAPGMGTGSMGGGVQQVGSMTPHLPKK